MTDLLLHTDIERLTGSQKVIGSIPIFSTEKQRVTKVKFVALFFAYKFCYTGISFIHII